MGRDESLRFQAERLPKFVLQDGEGMALGLDGVGLRIYDDPFFGVREHGGHFAEERAGGRVGAEGGKIVVGEGEWDGMILHLEELSHAGLKAVFVTETHVGDVDVEEVGDIPILFWQAGKFRNGEGEAVEIRVMKQADLFDVL